MKNIIYIPLLLITNFLFSQTGKKTFLLGISSSAIRETSILTLANNNSATATSFIISPSAGFFVKDNFEIGLNYTQFNKEEEYKTLNTSVIINSLGAYIKLHKPIYNDFGLFSELYALYGLFHSQIGENEQKGKRINLGVNIGAEYFIKKRLGLEVKFGIAEYLKESTDETYSKLNLLNSPSISIGIKFNIYSKEVFDLQQANGENSMSEFEEKNQTDSSQNLNKASLDSSTLKKKKRNKKQKAIVTGTTADSLFRSVFKIDSNLRRANQSIEEMKVYIYGLLTYPKEYVGKEMIKVLDDLQGKNITYEYIDEIKLKTAFEQKSILFKDVDTEKLKMNCFAILKNLDKMGSILGAVPQNSKNLIEIANHLPQKLESELKDSKHFKLKKILRQVNRASDKLEYMTTISLQITKNISTLIDITFELIDLANFNKKTEMSPELTGTSADSYLQEVYTYGQKVNKTNEDLHDLTLYTSAVLLNPRDDLTKDKEDVLSSLKIKKDSLEFMDAKGIKTAIYAKLSSYKDFDKDKLNEICNNTLNKLEEFAIILDQVPDEVKQITEKAKHLPDSLKKQLAGVNETKLKIVLKQLNQSSAMLDRISKSVPQQIVDITVFAEIYLQVLDITDQKNEAFRNFNTTGTSLDIYLQSLFDLELKFQSISKNMGNIKVYTYAVLTNPIEYTDKEIQQVTDELTLKGITAETIDTGVLNGALNNINFTSNRNTEGIKKTIENIIAMQREQELLLSKIPFNEKQNQSEAQFYTEKLKTELKGVKYMIRYPRVLKEIRKSEERLNILCSKTSKLVENSIELSNILTGILNSLKKK